MANESLNRAKAEQNDEFYTRYEDISNELTRYKAQLKGKHIICPCDWDESLDEVVVYASEEECRKENLMQENCTVKVIDTDKTDRHIEKDISLVKCNFVKFLIAHADAYGIASISVSGYNPKKNQGVRFQDIDYSRYDLVITNPPFSQFYEFMEVMFQNKLEFLVIGPRTASKSKDLLPRIINNEMWLGYGFSGGDSYFKIDPSNASAYADGVYDPETGFVHFRNCEWYTNLDVTYRHDKMILTEEYDPEKHPTYDNFDGIDVSSLDLIPYDWPGYMGVPITILAKYNPEQFEIIGIGTGDSAKKIGVTRNHRGRTDIAFTTSEGVHKCPFERIIVRNRNPRPTDE